MTDAAISTLPDAPRVLLLAIDGLDWPLLQTMVDAGLMPFCAQLLAGGAHGRMGVPPAHTSAAHWTTVATGVMSDRHGICHDLGIRADGLTLQAASADALRCEPLWQQAMGAGLVARVAGWPAMLPARLPPGAPAGCALVADGFQNPENGADVCWPLSPEAVAPPELRHTVQEARMHPCDLDLAGLAPLLGKPRGAAEGALLAAARQLMARWSSMHNLGVHWAAQPGWQLMALRFDSLPGWLATLQRHGIAPDDGLAPWYRYIDLMLGRYMGLLGRQAHLVLLSNHGLPPTEGCAGSTTVDRLMGVGSAGGIALAGPGVAEDSLLSGVSALDVAPTVLALLGLSAGPGMPGRDLLAPPRRAGRDSAAVPPPTIARMDWTELSAPPACDDAALAWLSDNGLAAPDTRAMQAMVRSVRAESLAGWAAARAASGDVTAAIAALQQALALNPAHLGHRLALGQWLLDAGRADECQHLVARLPDAARGGDWPDVVASLIAFGAKDWAAAEQPLLRLAALPAAPINAAAWLGRLHLAQEHWADAEPWLRRATTLAGGELVWDGLGLACLKLGQADEAISALTQAIAAQPANARLHLLRAIACQQAGQLDRAQDGLWRALAIDPSLGEARRRLGEIARAQADNKKPPGP